MADPLYKNGVKTGARIDARSKRTTGFGGLSTYNALQDPRTRAFPDKRFPGQSAYEIARDLKEQGARINSRGGVEPDRNFSPREQAVMDNLSPRDRILRNPAKTAEARRNGTLPNDNPDRKMGEVEAAEIDPSVDQALPGMFHSSLESAVGQIAGVDDTPSERNRKKAQQAGASGAAGSAAGGLPSMTGAVGGVGGAAASVGAAAASAGADQARSVRESVRETPRPVQRNMYPGELQEMVDAKKMQQDEAIGRSETVVEPYGPSAAFGPNPGRAQTVGIDSRYGTGKVDWLSPRQEAARTPGTTVDPFGRTQTVASEVNHMKDNQALKGVADFSMQDAEKFRKIARGGSKTSSTRNA